jgi:hypothetical protein
MRRLAVLAVTASLWSWALTGPVLGSDGSFHVDVCSVTFTTSFPAQGIVVGITWKATQTPDTIGVGLITPTGIPPGGSVGYFDVASTGEMALVFETPAETVLRVDAGWTLPDLTFIERSETMPASGWRICAVD